MSIISKSLRLDFCPRMDSGSRMVIPEKSLGSGEPERPLGLRLRKTKFNSVVLISLALLAIRKMAPTCWFE